MSVKEPIAASAAKPRTRKRFCIKHPPFRSRTWSRLAARGSPGGFGGLIGNKRRGAAQPARTEVLNFVRQSLQEWKRPHGRDGRNRPNGAEKLVSGEAHEENRGGEPYPLR